MAPDAGSGTGEVTPLGLPRRLSTSTLVLLGSRLATTLLGLAVWGVLARVLSPEEFGRLTFYLALSLLLDALADLGTSPAAVGESGGDPRRLAALLPGVRRVRLGGACLGFLLWTIVALAFEDRGRLGVVLAGLYPLSRWAEASSLAFHDAMRWRAPALVRGLGAAARLLAVLLLAGAGVRTMEPYLLVHAGVAVASNLLLHALARARLVAPREGPVETRRVLAAAWPLGLAAVAQATYFHVDNLFVRELAGAEEVGLYNGAVRLFSLAVLVPALATQVALPWLGASRRADRLTEAATRLLEPLLLLGSLGAAFLSLAAAPLLALIFGERFAGSATSLAWLAPGVLAVAAGSVLLTSLVALGRGRAVLGVAVAGAGANVAVNSLLVPLFGAEGAAAATLLTELLVAGLAGLGLARAGILPRLRPWSLVSVALGLAACSAGLGVRLLG